MRLDFIHKGVGIVVALAESDYLQVGTLLELKAVLLQALILEFEQHYLFVFGPERFLEFLCADFRGEKSVPVRR